MDRSTAGRMIAPSSMFSIGHFVYILRMKIIALVSARGLPCNGLVERCNISAVYCKLSVTRAVIYYVRCTIYNTNIFISHTMPYNIVMHPYIVIYQSINYIYIYIQIYVITNALCEHVALMLFTLLFSTDRKAVLGS